MKWRNRRVSSNIEDRRGAGRRGGAKKIGGLSAIIITLAAMYFGVDPKVIFGLLDNTGIGQSSSVQQSTYRPSAEQQQLADFTGVVLADTEDTWNAVFQQQGIRYQEPKLVYLLILFGQLVDMQKQPWGLFIARVITKYTLT